MANGLSFFKLIDLNIWQNLKLFSYLKKLSEKKNINLSNLQYFV